LNLSDRVRAWLMVFAAFVLGCAVQGPPPGGPQDTTPPQVAVSSPGPDSAGVEPDAAVSISFSEPMSRTGIERSIEFSPEIEMHQIRWKGNTVSITARDGFHPDTTYIVTIKAGIRDSHNVASKSPHEFAFATSAAIDTGAVLGRVMFRREPSEKARVHLFAVRDTVFELQSSRPDRSVDGNETGDYRLGYLSTDETALLVWAFHDSNNNGKYDAGNEYGAALGDTIRLSEQMPEAASRDIYIVDPTEPGLIEGQIVNQTGLDSVLIMVTLSEAGDTIPPTYVTFSQPDGAYQFDKALSGTYWLQAFMDFAADSLCGTYTCGADSSLTCVEPCVSVADSIAIVPGQEVTVPALILRMPEEAQ
jgi:hypothetical protein